MHWVVGKANLIWWRVKENIAAEKFKSFWAIFFGGLRLFVCVCVVVCVRRLSLFMVKDWKGFELKRLIKMGDCIFGKYEVLKRRNDKQNLQCQDYKMETADHNWNSFSFIFSFLLLCLDLLRNIRFLFGFAAYHTFSVSICCILYVFCLDLLRIIR